MQFDEGWDAIRGQSPGRPTHDEVTMGGIGSLHSTGQVSDRSAPDGAPPSAGTSDGVVETGTTVVGVRTDDAVVLAADRRASLGGRFVANKDVRKVEGVHPTAAVALSGGVGGIQSFVRTLRTEARLYEDRRGQPMSTTALSNLAANLLRSQPLRVTPVLGGVDDAGPHLFDLDAGGGLLESEYAAAGSGMQLAYGHLERGHDPDLPVDEARQVAARAVETASERDTASGNGLTVATVTAEGVETGAGEDPTEVA